MLICVKVVTFFALIHFILPCLVTKAKIIAKMGRIIEIKEELQRLKSGGEKSNNYSDADDSAIEEAASAAAGVSLPSDEEVERLLDSLQQSVEIWLNPGGKEKGGAEAEFLYDESWG